MQYCESGLKSGNDKRAVLVSGSSQRRHYAKYASTNYPIAKVLQSAAGANAVIGIWSMVRADMCSEVMGSKRITFPCTLPGVEISTARSSRVCKR